MDKSTTEYILHGSAKRRAPGLVNFVAAVAYHFCLALPAAFTQPWDHFLAAPSKSDEGGGNFGSPKSQSYSKLSKVQVDGKLFPIIVLWHKLFYTALQWTGQ